MKIQQPIIALDFHDWETTKAFLDKFDHQSLYVKVGMELFYQTGPILISRLKELGHKIFLDLKLHDIPNTVHKAMKGLAKLDVDMVNVHAAGGTDMMEAALAGLDAGTKLGKIRPNLIAVTQLTSTTEEQMNKEQLIQGTLNDSVLHYAKLAYNVGLDGVVCSALEANQICLNTSNQFLRVTPGIRLAGDTSHDQKRIVTPREASENKSSAIVVGRSITQAKSPLNTYLNIMSMWEESTNE